MYILRKFKRVVVPSFLGLLINHLRAESRRDFRSGYPLRSFQQGAEAGKEMKVYKRNQPFLSALLHLACTVRPGQQPALLPRWQGAPGRQGWDWEHWGGGLRSCSLSLGWKTSPLFLHLEALKLQGKLLWLPLEEGV